MHASNVGWVIIYEWTFIDCAAVLECAVVVTVVYYYLMLNQVQTSFVPCHLPRVSDVMTLEKAKKELFFLVLL